MSPSVYNKDFHQRRLMPIITSTTNTSPCTARLVSSSTPCLGIEKKEGKKKVYIAQTIRAGIL